MTEYSVFVAMLIAIVVLIKSDLETAFLRVWIPFFLLIPFNFWIHVPLAADYNFMSAAIFPLLLSCSRTSSPKSVSARWRYFCCCMWYFGLSSMP